MNQLRVLVVEDEPLVALLHEELIGLAGHVAVAIPQSYRQALAAAEVEQFDAALLDAQIWGFDADAIVAAVRRRNIPIIVCSGYPPDDLPEALQGLTTLSKPYMLADLTALLNELPTAA